LNHIKKKHLKIFFYILLLQTLVLSNDLFAFYTEKHPEEFLINVWTVEDGLPQNTIQTLLQTQDGFIWAGTPSGLVRFDGLNFNIYTRWNLPALKSDNITCLYEDQQNVLWIGTEGGGLCALQEGQWINFSTTNGLSSDHVRTIISDLKGELWVGTDYGLNRIYKDGIQVYTAKDGLYDNIITSLAVDGWNNLWIGTFRGGLAKYNQEIGTVYGYQEGLTNLSVRTLLTDQRGFLWIGTTEGMYYIKRDEGRVFPVSGTAHTPINAIIEKSPDYLWIGTMVGGLKQMNPYDLTRETVTDLLPDDFIHCILKDNAGNTWIGTDTGGLVQLKVRRISNITEKQGLPDNAVSAVYQDRLESIWIGTRNRGLFKFSGKDSYRVFNKKNGLSSDKVRVIFEDKNGLLWIGTYDEGINILDKNTIYSKLSTENGLSSNSITAILQDHQGNMWIGTENGLNGYANGRFSIYKRTTNATNLVINVLLKSRSQVLYAGTNEGVYKLSDNLLIPLQQISSADYRVISLYEDRDGALSEGMASRQCIGDGQPSFVKSKNGQVLYPTVNGVSVLDPKHLVDYCTTPKTTIERIFCGKDTVVIDEEQVPQLGGETITFTFTATEFAAPEKIRFKYMLEGYEKEYHYIYPGDERKAIYHNLLSGEHTFHLLAANNEGRWVEQAATFSFRINPPLYLNPVFLIIFIGLSLSLSSALIYYNHKRKKQKQLDKYKTSRLDPMKTEEIISALDDLMDREKLFLDPDLTLRDLSVRLKIQYRVDEVKKRLSDPDYMNKTVLEIMYETGFYSKSVFNTAFKKFTGMTPSEYRKRNN
jgi:ligand-binding sensor domain-containing protein/AraC-like DNA-binding protein